MFDKKANYSVLSRPDFSGGPRGRIVQVFFNVNMRNGHPGLTELAKKAGIPVIKLRPGDYVVFINAKLTMMKIFTAMNVIAAWRSPGNTRLDLNTVHLIPGCFKGSTDFDMDRALREVLQDALGHRVLVKKRA